MPVTPATLVRHELVGLEVAVVAAPNPDLEGIQGEVVLAAMSSSRSSRRAASATAAPASARAWAVASPMPELAPVTSAVSPASVSVAIDPA